MAALLIFKNLGMKAQFVDSVVDKEATKKAGKTKHKKVYLPVAVTEISCASANFTAIALKTQTNEDFDGAPNAYGSNRAGSALQLNLRPHDDLFSATSAGGKFPNTHHPEALASAGKIPTDFKWCGLVAATKAYAAANNLTIDDRYGSKGTSDDLRTNRPGEDKTSYPVVQTKGSYAGYFISKTNPVKHGSVTDPGIYANPLILPMVVRTGSWKHQGVRVGDFGWAVHEDYVLGSAFTFGDTNISNHVGESSPALLNGLGRPHRAIFLGFPRSGHGKAKDGDLIGMDVPTMLSGVRIEFGKLNNVDNRMALLDFLACGADFDQFERFRSGNAMDQKLLTQLRGKSSRLYTAATAAGFPLLLNDFESSDLSSRPV